MRPESGEVASVRQRKRRSLRYVSRHFAPSSDEGKLKNEGRSTKRRKLDDEKEAPHDESITAPDSKLMEGDVQMTKIPSRSKRVNEAQSWPTISNAGHSAALQIVRRKNRKRLSSSDADRAFTPSEEVEDSAQVLPERSLDENLRSSRSLVPWQKVLTAPPEKQQKTFHRIYCGIDVDALSSDSELTDVPDEIGPDPFSVSPPERKFKTNPQTELNAKKSKVVVVKELKPKPASKTKSKPGLTQSPYFPQAHKPRPTFLSTLPFPPLQLKQFGLMQERLCHDPFRLLLATIFLNKTPGSRAMPIFFKLMEKYPTPEDLARGEQADVTSIIHELGFQNQRARKCIAMAKRWIEDPPVKGKRWRKVGYPDKGDGKDIKIDEVVDDDDERVAWEISHLPGLGPYSHDSWRMFCRDELRRLARSYNGEGVEVQADNLPFEPEWKRVLPADKELRAWMTWMWMKEGWVWNKETGERTKANEELMELARGKGNVVLESEASTLVVKSLVDDKPTPQKFVHKSKQGMKVEAPAGDFMLDSRGKAEDGREEGVG